MTATAFEQTILVDIRDDGPRLIYADWLDERGDPLGAYIRNRVIIDYWCGHRGETVHHPVLGPIGPSEAAEATVILGEMDDMGDFADHLFPRR